jgi:hypothetical protein
MAATAYDRNRKKCGRVMWEMQFAERCYLPFLREYEFDHGNLPVQTQ